MSRSGCYLSVDLEDYKHATMRDLGLPPLCASDQTRRGVEVLLNVIDGLSGHPRLTFFTTGQVARSQRPLVAELAQSGHEIGCHTDEHDNVFTMTPEAFVADLQRSRATLQDATGQPVEGFRAPNFSIDSRCPWAFEALADCGFKYDSSLRTSKRSAPAGQAWDLYTMPDGSPLYEIPLYSRRLGALRISVIGGTYFRLLPLGSILSLIGDAISHGFTPLIYLHAADLFTGGRIVTWRELAGLTPLRRAGWFVRQHQWTARAQTVPDKLRAVLAKYPNLGPMRSALPN